MYRFLINVAKNIKQIIKNIYIVNSVLLPFASVSKLSLVGIYFVGEPIYGILNEVNIMDNFSFTFR